MAAEVTRDVVMQLKLVAHPGNAAVAASVAAQAAKGRQAAGGAKGDVDSLKIEKELNNAVAAEAKARAATLKIEQEQSKSAAESLKTEASLNAAVIKEQQARQAVLKTEQESLKTEREKLRLAAEAAKIKGAPKAAADKAAEKQEKLVDDMAARETAAHNKAAADRVKADEAASQRIALNRQKLLGKIAAADQMAAKQAEAQGRASALRQQALNEKAFMSQQSASMAFSRAGHGILAAGKSAVMAGMFTDSEEDLQKLVTNLMKVEIAFQGLRGGLDIVTGLRQGMFMLSRASAATAAEQGLRGIGGAAAGSAVGGVAASAAGGGLASGGIMAAGGAATAGLGSMAAAAGMVALKFLAIPLAGAELIQGLRRGRDVFTRMEGPGESIISAMFSWREAVGNAAKSTETLAKATEATGKQIAERRVAKEEAAEAESKFATEKRTAETKTRENLIELTVGKNLPPAQRDAERLKLIRAGEANDLKIAQEAANAARKRAVGIRAGDLARARGGVTEAEQQVKDIQAAQKLSQANRATAMAGGGLPAVALSKLGIGVGLGTDAADAAELKAAREKVTAATVRRDEMKGKAETSYKEQVATLREVLAIQSRIADKDMERAKSSREAADIQKKSATEKLGGLDSASQERFKSIAETLEKGGAFTDTMKMVIKDMGLEDAFKDQFAKDAAAKGLTPSVNIVTKIAEDKAVADEKIAIESQRKEAAARLNVEPIEREQAGLKNEKRDSAILKLGDEIHGLIAKETEETISTFNLLMVGWTDELKQLRAAFEHQQTLLAGQRR